METKYYDLAGEIVLKLNNFGNTTVKRKLSPLKATIETRFKNITDETKEIEELYNSLIKTITNAKITNDELVNMFLYLSLLDTLSDSLTMQTNTLTASGEALNESNRDKIEVYFTYPGIDRNSSHNEHYTYSLNNLIFFIKDKEVYKKLKFKNIYISKETEKLRIGFAPYPPCSNLVFVEQENKIVAKERTCLDKFDNDYLQAVNHLIDNKCDVILGPEMHGSKELDDEIKKLFFKSESNILVCPSWHRDIDRQIRNRSDVFYRHEINRNRTYLDKCVPAEFSDKKTEGLTYDEETLYNFVILHVKGFGRVLFLICRDFLSEDINQLIEDLNVDVVFVQCYTPDLTAFKSFADRVQNKRLIIVGNSCKAIKDAYGASPEHPSPFLCFYYDFKHKKDSDPKLCFESKCKMNCTYNCANCCKIIDVCKSEYKNNNKTKEGIFVL